jgi:hypothetical protein
VRDHYFAPGIFAEDVRWIARCAVRARADDPAVPASPAPPGDPIECAPSGQDDMKAKPKPRPRRAAGSAGTRRRRGPGTALRRYKRPALVWEAVVPAVKFRRDGPWELGSALE